MCSSFSRAETKLIRRCSRSRTGRKRKLWGASERYSTHGKIVQSWTATTTITALRHNATRRTSIDLRSAASRYAQGYLRYKHRRG